MPRIRHVDDKIELEKLIDDFVVSGYRIKAQEPSSVLMKKKDWGSGELHLLIFVFLGWWTLGIANAVYAIYARYTADEVQIKISDNIQGKEIDLQPRGSELYETTVGERWYYAVIGPTILTIPSVAMLSSTPENKFIGIISVMLLCAVFIPVIGVYFDRKYVRANCHWSPSILWVLGFFFLYPINIVLALLYMYKRLKSLGEPNLLG